MKRLLSEFEFERVGKRRALPMAGDIEKVGIGRHLVPVRLSRAPRSSLAVVEFRDACDRVDDAAEGP